MPITSAPLFQEFIAAADEKGFVPLKAFAQIMLKRSARDIETFFDPEGRFYELYKTTVIHNIRHNVTFVCHFKKNGTLKNRSSEGGVYKDDLQVFIQQAKSAIEENTKKFDVAYQTYYGSNE